jgi:hypothetical protein
MADDPVFVYDESGTAANEPLLVEDAVSLDHLSLDIAEQWECHPYVFLEAVVSRVAVNADADDLCVRFFEFGNISLIRLQLFRSTAGEGEHIEGERDVLLSPKIRELDGLSIRVSENEIGCHLPDLELCLRGTRLLRGCTAVTVIGN